MNVHRLIDGDTDGEDRQLIRVDPSSAQAGVAAALRRAFQAGASSDVDRQWEELLARLH